MFSHKHWMVTTELETTGKLRQEVELSSLDRDEIGKRTAGAASLLAISSKGQHWRRPNKEWVEEHSGSEDRQQQRVWRNYYGAWARLR